MSPSVLLLGTLETKAEEVAFLLEKLAIHEVDVVTVDVSLKTNGKTLGGAEKKAAMEQAVSKAIADVTHAMENGVNAILGIGGGTG